MWSAWHNCVPLGLFDDWNDHRHPVSLSFFTTVLEYHLPWEAILTSVCPELIAPFCHHCTLYLFQSSNHVDMSDFSVQSVSFMRVQQYAVHLCILNAVAQISNKNQQKKLRMEGQILCNSRCKRYLEESNSQRKNVAIDQWLPGTGGKWEIGICCLIGTRVSVWHDGKKFLEMDGGNGYTTV